MEELLNGVKVSVGGIHPGSLTQRMVTETDALKIRYFWLVTLIGIGTSTRLTRIYVTGKNKW